MSDVQRCVWCGTDPLYTHYHDTEWGVPLHSAHGWYERIVLETMQAGLSWITVLRKRDHYRRVCDHFDPEIVARYGPADVERLVLDPGIIRNRAKIEAMIGNAQAFLRLSEKHGDIDAFFWNFVDGTPQQPRYTHHGAIPTITPIATHIATTLKTAGFRFVGPTMCYALMQATGMTNDHVVDCHRHDALVR